MRGSTWAIVAALFLAEITGAFETAMIYAALNKLIAAFGDPVLVGWLVTTYLLVGAGAAAVAGRLGDIYGRRRVILMLLAVGVAGSVMSAMATSFATLLAGRALQGLTGAILPLCVGLVRENLEPAKVPMGIGLMISGASSGTALGLVVGGMIVDHLSWHGIFVASALFAALSFVAILIALPPSPRLPLTKGLDWIGGVLFVPGIAGLLLVISNGRSWGFADGRTLTILALSIAILALWARQALRVSDPLIDIRLFRDRRVLIANMVAAVVSMSTLQITLVFSVLLQAPAWTGVGLGVSATVAGLAKLPSNIGSLFAGPLSGFLTARRGGRFVMVLGGLLTTGGWIAAMVFHGSVAVIVAILCLISFGATVLFAVGPNVIVEAVPHDRTSEAVGMMTVIRQTFLGVGAQLIAVLLATETVVAPEGGARYPTPGAFMLAMGVIVALCLLAIILSLMLPSRVDGVRNSANGRRDRAEGAQG